MNKILIITLMILTTNVFSVDLHTAKAGKYSVELSTQPAIPSVGENLLIINIKDGDKPLTGADVDVHIDMTTMPMPADAKATPGRKDGEYGATVNLSMAGQWKVDISIQQMAGMKMDGDGTAQFIIETGKGITAKNNNMKIPWLKIIIAVIILFILLSLIFYRRITPKNRGYIAGTLTLIIVMIVTIIVVNKYRDPKTSTVIASANMDMTAQAAPGTVSVETEKVVSSEFQSSVSYTGTVVPDQEVDIFPRVTGRLVSMPFYPGDKVTAGQVVAQLDTSELTAKEDQALYGSLSANNGISAAKADIATARAEYSKALKAVDQAIAQYAQVQSASRASKGALKAAQSDVNTTRKMAQEAESAIHTSMASVDAVNEAVIQAQGDVDSTQADVLYWTDEISREKKLYEQGAIAKEELDRETAQASAATAKLSQAKAALRAALANVKRANKEVEQAKARQEAAQAGIATAEARVEQAQAERDSAQQKIAEAKAGIDTAQADVKAAASIITSSSAKAGMASQSAKQAKASLTEASTVKGYTTIRAGISGVVTARNIPQGTLVQPGMSIMKIAKIDIVRIQVNIAEADLPKVTIGTTLRAHSIDAPTKPVSALVSAIFPAQDTTSRTAIVEALIHNTGNRLRPGQYLSVELMLGEKNKKNLSVPTSAIIARDGEYSVYTVADDGLQTKVKRISVTTGKVNNNRTEILSGIKEDDEVIISGLSNLHDGDSVTVLNKKNNTTEKKATPTPAVKQWYHCPMDLDMESTKPDKCPKCGMDYVPFDKKQGN
jgi:HlyD family secretion protein